MSESGVREIAPSGGDRVHAGSQSGLARALQAMAEAELAIRTGSAAGLFDAAAHLESAVEACRQYGNHADGPGDRQMDGERLTLIRTGLRRISALMAQSAEFHAGWARLAGMRASAYGPDGTELGLPAGSASGSRCDASG